MRVLASGYFGFFDKFLDLNEIISPIKKFSDDFLFDVGKFCIGHVGIAIQSQKIPLVSDISRILDSQLKNQKIDDYINFFMRDNKVITPIRQFPPSWPEDFTILKLTFDDYLIIQCDSGVYMGNLNYLQNMPRKFTNEKVRDAYFCNDEFFYIDSKDRLFRIDHEGQIFPITSDGKFVEKCSKLVGGFEHICVLTYDGCVFTYGSGTKGQIGCDRVVVTTEEAFELDCFGIVKIKDIVSGGWHILAHSENDDLYAWGWNESFQVGIVEPQIVAIPQLLTLNDDENQSPDIFKIAAGSQHSVVIDTNNNLWVWGNNENGQLFQDSSTKILPMRINNTFENQNTLTDIICGRWSTFVFLN